MNERFFAEHMSRPVVLGRGISSGGHPNVVDLLKLAAAEIRRTFPECHFDVHGAWYEVEGRSVPYSQAL
jgi:hypothetical protein